MPPERGRDPAGAADAGLDSPALPECDQPRPSQIVQAVELWETILDFCPPTHREILRLKREGLPLAEIASRTGLHEGSVRRIIYELAKRLAVGAVGLGPAP